MTSPGETTLLSPNSETSPSSPSRFHASPAIFIWWAACDCRALLACGRSAFLSAANVGSVQPAAAPPLSAATAAAAATIACICASGDCGGSQLRVVAATQLSWLARNWASGTVRCPGGPPPHSD